MIKREIADAEQDKDEDPMNCMQKLIESFDGFWIYEYKKRRKNR